MKERLDKILTERGLAESRARAIALIMAGQVTVNNRIITKAGTSVNTDADNHYKTELSLCEPGRV